MSGFLKIIVTGAHIGRDAASRFTPTGKQVISFTCASNRQFNGSNGEPVKETTWLNCTIWPVSEAQGDFFTNNLLKGKKVSFEGRLQVDPESGGPRMWTGQDGMTHTSNELVINPLTLDISNNGIANGIPAGEGLAGSEDQVPF